MEHDVACTDLGAVLSAEKHYSDAETSFFAGHAAPPSQHLYAGWPRVVLLQAKEEEDEARCTSGEKAQFKLRNFATNFRGGWRVTSIRPPFMMRVVLLLLALVALAVR